MAGKYKKIGAFRVNCGGVIAFRRIIATLAKKMTVSREHINTCPKCGGTVTQDPDVLDTWFSSALWLFSTLGWLEKSEDLDYFYPSDVLVTAHEIIFFWVVRMVFSGIEFMGKEPFSDVVINGIVRDKIGRKMSKSLGNGVDPLEMIEKYGTDSVRFSLLWGTTLGSDIKFSEDKIATDRVFINKSGTPQGLSSLTPKR